MRTLIPSSDVCVANSTPSLATAVTSLPEGGLLIHSVLPGHFYCNYRTSIQLSWSVDQSCKVVEGYVVKPSKRYEMVQWYFSLASFVH